MISTGRLARDGRLQILKTKYPFQSITGPLLRNLTTPFILHELSRFVHEITYARILKCLAYYAVLSSFKSNNIRRFFLLLLKFQRFFEDNLIYFASLRD